MKFQELKKESNKVLHKNLAVLREKLRDLRFSISAKQLKNIREIREVKMNIAQILTLLNQSRHNEKVEEKTTEILNQEK